MIVNIALLLLARSASTALLAMVSWRYVAAYYAGDHIIYLTQKAARGDWWPRATHQPRVSWSSSRKEQR